ncbi:phage exclusion protein Lit family protein [Agitococcus lubricus]|uniref:Peptidase U49-like protein n=1 Tax=Agitococcus lubricus TaxID=1077255 RepID=A0A2T5IZF7_9GAMM|nr:phage exclusion protein Lit family protein [Agitococcus lubricus]PTQ89471.1 peptidase U49-like protein [Agitococcus lubricus]
MTNISEAAVKNAILGSAPERKEELEKLWLEHMPQVNQIEDRLGFSLEAGSFGLILFNHKTMCKIWLLGFAAQKSFNLYYPYLFLSQATGTPFAPLEITQEDASSKLKESIISLLESVSYLKSIESIEQFSWPQAVPKPDSGKPKDINGSMAFDILCITAAYCFLHELKHVQFRNSNTILDYHQEEYECDKYARDFLLEKIEVYSRTSGYDLALLKSKRGMAIALASVMLLVITPEDNWKGSTTHPPVLTRIQELVDNINVSDNDYFWQYLSCLLLSVIEHKKIAVTPSVVKTQQGYCQMLLAAIDSHLTSASSATSTQPIIV